MRPIYRSEPFAAPASEVENSDCTIRLRAGGAATLEPQRMRCRSCRCAEPPQRELGQGDEIGTEQKNQTDKKADKDAGQQEPESAHYSPATPA
jgi:hypothetical protein